MMSGCGRKEVWEREGERRASRGVVNEKGGAPASGFGQGCAAALPRAYMYHGGGIAPQSARDAVHVAAGPGTGPGPERDAMIGSIF